MKDVSGLIFLQYLLDSLPVGEVTMLKMQSRGSGHRAGTLDTVSRNHIPTLVHKVFHHVRADEAFGSRH
jgi:hypothetical protein